MAAVMSPQHEMMDTRTPSPVQRSTTEDETAGDYKPDLSAEVAMLSTKLVNAINYQTNLDDSLAQARHELEQANQELTRLRAQKTELDEMIASGALVRYSSVETRLAQMRSDLSAERASREAAEKAKKQTDVELESLTVSLFEEANKMVAAARKESDDAVAAAKKETFDAERRNQQLKTQLKDTELLLESQREQLQDLKSTLERMDRLSEHDTASGGPSVPSTPITTTAAAFDLQLSPHADGLTDVPPEHPLYFHQLLVPIMRNDINAYSEFLELLSIARLYRVNVHSRNGSHNGSTNGMAPLSTTGVSLMGATPALPGSFSLSTSNSPQSIQATQSGPPLKECKFYKRALVEDLEPTLRLDLAPGLSFLSRRTVMSAILQGSLAVEPFMQQSKFHGPVFSCALCGENRKHDPYLRKHRFRTSEEESAQRYPLCDYCLCRIRATGDFVGFLRMVRDGHWRADNEDEQRSAWEESVRLRERMFWARLGGGVVPALQTLRGDGPHSPSADMHKERQSLESVMEEKSTKSIDAESQVVDASVNGFPEVASLRETTDIPRSDGSVQSKDRSSKRLSSVGRTILGATSGVVAIAAPQVSPQEVEHDISATADDEEQSFRNVEDDNKTLRPSEEDNSGVSDLSTAAEELDDRPKSPKIPEHAADDGASQSINSDVTSEQTRPEIEEVVMSDVRPLSADEELSPTSPKDTAAQVDDTIDDSTVAPIPRSSSPFQSPRASVVSTTSTIRSPSPSKSVRSLSPQKSPKRLSLQTSHERRPSSSSVLARVKAMETKAQAKIAADKKLPGSFE